MVKKTVNLSTKAEKAEEWITSEEKIEDLKSRERIKRLTLDIPASLHKKIKYRAVIEETTMIELLRDILTREFSKK